MKKIAMVRGGEVHLGIENFLDGPATSNIGKALEQNKLNIPSDRKLPSSNEKLPYVIIEKETFLLKNYLLKPYPGPQIYEDEQKSKSTNSFHGREKLLKMLLDE